MRRGLLAVGLLCAGGCGQQTGDTGSVLTGAPGLFRLSLVHDGDTREAIVYVPESFDASGSPALLLNLHGFGGTDESHLLWTDMRDLADRDGTIVVYPQGSELEGSPHWNSSLPSEDNKSPADDFGFFEVLLDTIGASYAYDPSRVYAVGYSNGGMMSFGLACFRSDLVAAVGSVSGAMLDDAVSGCETSHPTSVITLHGTADSVLPYEGGPGHPSAADVLDFWVEANRTTDTPDTGQDSDGGRLIEHEAWEDGAGGTAVHHYRYLNGDHVWFEETYQGADASTLVWDFLHRFDQQGAL